MGYDLHITRKTWWADPEGPEISLVDWIAYALGDPDLQSDPDNPDPKNWLFVSAEQPWPLWWRRDTGAVYSKNPPPDVVLKMIAIAQALEARVLGDDDEIYSLNAGGEVQVEQR